MTAPKFTYGHALLHDYEGFPFKDDSEYQWSSHATSNGTTTTTIDTGTSDADDTWNGYWIKYLTGSNAGVYKKITDWVQGTNTYTHEAFSNATATNDTYIISRWTETDANSIATWTGLYKDYIKVTVTPSANAQTSTLSYHFSTNPLITTWPKLYVRWKTSDLAANGVKAGLIITDSASNTQTQDLGYSAEFTADEITLAAPLTNVDKIALIVTSDGATAGTHYVYFDFILVCQGFFTLPYAPDDEWMETSNTYAFPGLLLNIAGGKQWLGAPPAVYHAEGKIDTNTSWHSGSGQDAEHFYKVWHYSYTEPWQWFESDLIKCKMNPHQFRIGKRKDLTDAVKYFIFEMQEYRRSSGSNEYAEERFGYF